MKKSPLLTQLQRHANEASDLLKNVSLATSLRTIRTERWGLLLVEVFEYRCVITTETGFHVQVPFDSKTKNVTVNGAVFDLETWMLIQKVVRT